MDHDVMTDAAPPSRYRKKRGKARGLRLFIRDILIIFLAALLISIGIKAFLVRSFYIPSPSMTNTLQVNDRIVVNELVPNVVSVQHGDVVVFKDPGGWLDTVPTAQPSRLVAAVDFVLSVVGISAPDSDDHLVKRVIGLPGDKVVCCNAFGQITVNGIPLAEPYLNLPDGVTKASKVDFSVSVPQGDLWVMGDNRYNSADSAYHHDKGDLVSFVPISNVVGRAFIITWPSSHWGWLDDYPQVFDGVDKTSE